VTAGDAVLLDPASREWNAVRASELTLRPTPITAQPSLYVQAKWNDEPYGILARLAVRAAHDGARLYLRLFWMDETNNEGIRDTDQFADAAAVLFPVNSDAPLQSMGSPEAPVNAWYWRADLEDPLSITAQGTGTTRRTHAAGLASSVSLGSAHAPLHSAVIAGWPPAAATPATKRSPRRYCSSLRSSPVRRAMMRSKAPRR